MFLRFRFIRFLPSERVAKRLLARFACLPAGVAGPVTSWSAVDGDERAKPLLYALRQAHADRLLTIQPTDVGLRVALVNDSLSSWRGENL